MRLRYVHWLFRRPKLLVWTSGHWMDRQGRKWSGTIITFRGVITFGIEHQVKGDEVVIRGRKRRSA